MAARSTARSTVGGTSTPQYSAIRLRVSSKGVRPTIGARGRKRDTSRALAPLSVNGTTATASRSAAACTAARHTVAATSSAPPAGGGGGAPGGGAPPPPVVRPHGSPP